MPTGHTWFYTVVSRYETLNVKTFMGLNFPPYKMQESTEPYSVSKEIKDFFMYDTWNSRHSRCQVGYSIGQTGEFCKPQANYFRLKVGLMKLMSKVDTSVREWYIKVQNQNTPCYYPPETSDILSGDIVLFGMQDYKFPSRCLKESTID